MRKIERRDITVPNALTVLRMIMTVAAAFLLAGGESRQVAAFLLLTAMLLDYFDGWYARRFRQTTRLGAHLDPFADKVMMAVIFIALAAELRTQWFALLVAVILTRELTITVYRWVVHERSGTLVPASPLGKIKTLVQCIVGGALIFYIYVYPGRVPESHRIILIAMLVTVFVTVDSGLRYVLPNCRDGKKRSVIERLLMLLFGSGAREA